MPLVLAPSFDDHSREEVEQYLELVRMKRISGAIEYQAAKATKLHVEGTTLGDRLNRTWEQLGKALIRLDRDMEMVEKYLEACTMLKDELGLVLDRIDASKV